MRFIVYGAGAIGGLVGGRLALQGHDVVLIARGEHARVMQVAGLTIESADGDTVVRTPVVTDPDDAGISPGDVVMLAMKSQDTGSALDALCRTAAPSTPIVCLQNGVANEAAALRRFRDVYGVCVMCPATHLEPGVVRQNSSPVPGLFDIGRFPQGNDDLGRVVADALRSASFDSIELDDVMRWKYRKLLLNLGNAVQAVFHGSGMAAITEQAQAEAEQCFRAAGIAFASAEEDAERRRDRLKMQSAPGARRGGGSTWQSLERRTGSIEADYLNGEIVLLGRRLGLATPVNELLQELVWDAARTGARPGARPAEEFDQMLAGSLSARA